MKISRMDKLQNKMIDSKEMNMESHKQEKEETRFNNCIMREAGKGMPRKQFIRQVVEEVGPKSYHELKELATRRKR